MRLVKKLGLVFLCCLPVGVATSGYELNFRKVSDSAEGLKDTLLVDKDIKAENSKPSIEAKVLEEEEKNQELQEDVEESSKLNVSEISAPVENIESRAEEQILPLPETSTPEEKNTAETDVTEDKEEYPSSVISEEPQRASQEVVVSEPKLTASTDKEPKEDVITEQSESVESQEKTEPNNTDDSLKNEMVLDSEKPAEAPSEIVKQPEEPHIQEALAVSEKEEQPPKPLEVKEAKSENVEASVEEKLIPDNAKEESKDASSPESAKLSTSSSGVTKIRTFSAREQQVRAIIGVADGPITKNNVRGGLLKLHRKRSRSVQEQQMYIFLMKLLGEFERFKKIVTVI